jgi:hypothetical protein
MSASPDSQNESPLQNGDMKTELPPPTRKERRIADHPHGWTITLSLIAIVVSGLSYYEAHRSLRLNQEVNRPLVRVTAIDAGLPALGDYKTAGDRYPVTYTLHVRNSGKVYADSVVVSFKAQLEDMRTGSGFRRFSDDNDATIDEAKIGPLAPEEDYESPFWASVLKDMPTIPFGDHVIRMVSLYVKGKVIYVDPLNNSRIEEPFCFYDAGTNGHFTRCTQGEQPK